MKCSRGLAGLVTVVLLGSVSVPLLGSPASAAAPVASCRSADHPALAAELARDIDRALRGRVAASEAGVDAPGPDEPHPAVAVAVNHDLNPGAKSVVPAAAASSSWGTPDEVIPAP